MPEQPALKLADLPIGGKKTVTLDGTEILLVRTEDLPGGRPTIFALEAKCPHAGAPLEKGAVCNGRLICPFHAGTFALETGTLLEPPPLRDLKRYAVRLAGDDLLVDPTPLSRPTPAPVAAGKHLVFAGAGAATASALAFLRDAGFAGTVTVLDPEMDEPIDRTQLTKASLAGKKPVDTLPLFFLPGQAKPAEGGQTEGREPLEPLKIQRLKAHLTALDPEAGTFTVGGSRTEPFDALLLATGSLPKRPDLPGADLPHVFTIRHSADLRRMEPLLGEGKRAVLIGDSFIAFEAASALKQRGLEVTLLAQSALPFAKKFGPVVAEAMNHLHKTKGVTILPNTETVAITEKDVEFKDVQGAAQGDRLPADVVILAIGVTPVVDYAPDLPHAEKGGFLLEPDLRAARNVWAAGDIASVNGTRIEHWRLAEQHGRAAAQAMLAAVSGGKEAEPFAGVPLFWTAHFGKRFNYAGHADSWDRIAYDGDPMQLDFLAYFVKDEKIAAVLECGRDTALAALMEPLREPLSLEQAQRLTASANSQAPA